MLDRIAPGLPAEAPPRERKLDLEPFGGGVFDDGFVEGHDGLIWRQLHPSKDSRSPRISRNWPE